MTQTLISISSFVGISAGSESDTGYYVVVLLLHDSNPMRNNLIAHERLIDPHLLILADVCLFLASCLLLVTIFKMI